MIFSLSTFLPYEKKFVLHDQRTRRDDAPPPTPTHLVVFCWWMLRELITRSRNTLSGLNAFFTTCCREQRDTIKAFVKPSKNFWFPSRLSRKRQEDRDWKLIGSVSVVYLHFVLLKMQLITRDEEICREMRCVALVALLPADCLCSEGV